MVNHRSQIHLAQTGDDDRSQTGRELAYFDSNQMKLKAPFLFTFYLLLSLLFIERKVAPI